MAHNENQVHYRYKDLWDYHNVMYHIISHIRSTFFFLERNKKKKIVKKYLWGGLCKVDVNSLKYFNIPHWNDGAGSYIPPNTIYRYK